MISNLPSNFANAITPFTPLGRQPVGQESTENRNTPLKPVEESASSAELLNRRNPEDQPNSTANVNLQKSDDTPRRGQQDRDPQNSDTQKQNADQQEQAQIRELATRDREVKQHERAHAAVGGELAGAPSYSYERGPNGLSYAVSGEVPIRLSEISGDPQATLELARLVRQAALAPAEPSTQDRRVAAQAAQLEAEASQELLELKRDQIVAEADAQQISQEQTQLQKEREKAQREDEERFSAVQDDVDKQRQVELAAEADARLQEINRRTLELNQRILTITAISPSPDIGSLLDQRV